LYLSGWVLIFTSLPLEVLDTQTAASLYRVRWQVELAIKRMKSLLDIDRLRAFKDSPLAELYLYGKLLYAAVVEKITNRRFSRAMTGMVMDRKLTPWRPWNLINEAVHAAIIGCFEHKKRYELDAIKSMSERPRKRKLQTLPEPIFGLINK